MTRRAQASVVANPVLIGAITVLVAVVAVFLAYQANSGLPFVPTYEVRAELPDAANLVRGADVRIGGSRAGRVSAIDVVRRENGSIAAVLDLQLDESAGPLPADSTVLVRPRSALGLKYVEIARGRSGRTLAQGATLPARSATPAPVEIDEVVGMFDVPTRVASRDNLSELGGALAGRGGHLNRALGDLARLLERLEPVMSNLADPKTRLGRLVSSLQRTAAEVAPVAAEQRDLVRGLDATFTPLAGVARPYLRDAIAKGPGTLSAATASLPRQRPFLRETEALFAELRPGARSLRESAGHLAGGFGAGARTLRSAPALNRRLASLLTAVEELATDGAARTGLRTVTATAGIAAPTIAHVAPAQTTCNYLTLFLRNASSLLSVGNGTGTWQRFIIVATPQGPNNEGGPASAPAAGPGPDNFLHANPYPNTAAPGQTRECEAANEPYSAGRQAIGNPAGSQGTSTEKTTRDRGVTR